MNACIMCTKASTIVVDIHVKSVECTNLSLLDLNWVTTIIKRRIVVVVVQVIYTKKNASFIIIITFFFVCCLHDDVDVDMMMQYVNVFVYGWLQYVCNLIEA